MRCNIVVMCFRARIEGHGKFLKKHSLKLSLVLVFFKNFVLVFVFSDDTCFNFQMTLEGTVNFLFLWKRNRNLLTQYIFQFNTFNLVSLSWESLCDFDVDDCDCSSSSFMKLTHARHYSKQLHFRYFTLTIHTQDRGC